jgi:hypothetical protein
MKMKKIKGYGLFNQRDFPTVFPAFSGIINALK